MVYIRVRLNDGYLQRTRDWVALDYPGPGEPLFVSSTIYVPGDPEAVDAFRDFWPKHLTDQLEDPQNEVEL